eukprot:CAMPEP_0174335040 /NCGR_PEP_ID=MMETSP0810-20121108/20442_1 /TAXON_ID=73025 ORGANISM="Eutreptiella gymnastica-like, Strain CCMP1594" /NCGR_SAMPLE_ID=MMETSP0810 /ASSEMBLY_ACC=CAM_ASM_000659 /LENGTH=42 /DNA_ID= /DNA_START= /DNA_END= /DNA_ORIENTATION=
MQSCLPSSGTQQDGPAPHQSGLLAVPESGPAEGSGRSSAART